MYSEDFFVDGVAPISGSYSIYSISGGVGGSETKKEVARSQRKQFGPWIKMTLVGGDPRHILNSWTESLAVFDPENTAGIRCLIWPEKTLADVGENTSGIPSPVPLNGLKPSHFCLVSIPVKIKVSPAEDVSYLMKIWSAALHHTHFKFLTNRTTVVGHYTKRFCPDNVMRTIYGNRTTTFFFSRFWILNQFLCSCGVYTSLKSLTS